MTRTDQFQARRFANGGIHLRAYGTNTTQQLTLEQIKRDVPSIFAPGKHESRSAKYTFIPTGDVLLGLMREGFVVTEVRQGGSRIPGKADFTKHMLRLRRAGDAPNVVGVSDQLYPEIVVTNAHDGTGAWVLGGGAFRVLCKNSLVASTSFDEIKIPHKGDVIDNVIEGAFRVVNELPKVVEQANEWARLAIPADMQRAYAKAALQLRWAPEEDPLVGMRDTAPISPDAVLQAHRYGDQGSDLWKTFNRVQENLLAGGARYVQRDAEGRHRARRTVRAVNGVEANKGLNTALWTLTTELAKLAA